LSIAFLRQTVWFWWIQHSEVRFLRIGHLSPRSKGILWRILSHAVKSYIAFTRKLSTGLRLHFLQAVYFYTECTSYSATALRLHFLLVVEFCRNRTCKTLCKTLLHWGFYNLNIWKTKYMTLNTYVLNLMFLLCLRHENHKK
jgi:hypothetical protein